MEPEDSSPQKPRLTSAIETPLEAKHDKDEATKKNELPSMHDDVAIEAAPSHTQVLSTGELDRGTKRKCSDPRNHTPSRSSHRGRKPRTDMGFFLYESPSKSFPQTTRFDGKSRNVVSTVLKDEICNLKSEASVSAENETLPSITETPIDDKSPRDEIESKSKKQDTESAPPTALSAANSLNGGKRKRSGRQRSTPATNIIKTTADSSTSTKRRRAVDGGKDFSTSWICCECGEAECSMLSAHQKADTNDDDLIICEGTCCRLFHYPCAGLSRMPLPHETYVCHDCQVGQHACAFCHTYGVDHVDVFPCSQVNQCGLFYHESCLVLNDISFQLVPMGSDDPRNQDSAACGEEPLLRREFTCPAHSCWTCSFVAEDEVSQSKKVKKKKGRPASTVNKNSRGLMRCLKCPRAFHVRCIPPAARFHELALLCHEHALTHKLPELDSKHSLQSRLEEAICKKFESTDKRNVLYQRATVNGEKNNNFFGGLSGNVMTKAEKLLLQDLSCLTNKENENDDSDDDGLETLEALGILPFCLPCGIKDDIYSKPPPYKHVQSLQYNNGGRPQRILPMQGERCQCVGRCGDDCINKVLYVECFGDAGSPHSNCNVGKECGNRRLGRRQFVKCKPQREQGRGWGLVPCTDVKAGDLVTEYVGEVIDASTKEERLANWAKDHPNDSNFYVMSLSNQWYIDAREVANLSRFINHSCQPNCRLTQVNVDGYLRNGIFALVDIPAGEFLSYDYRFDTRQDEDKFICRCGAPNCRGTMKSSLVPKALMSSSSSTLHPRSEAEKKAWEQAKKDLLKDEAFVHDFYAKREERRSQVQAMVPAASNSSEYVSNGVQARSRTIHTPRLFLWRNAVVGSDFETRLGKLNQQTTYSTPNTTKTSSQLPLLHVRRN